MAILDTITVIADRRTSAITSRRNARPGGGVSAGGSSHDAPVLVRHSRSIRPVHDNHPEAEPQEEARLSGRQANPRRVRNQSIGRFGQFLSSMGINIRRRENSPRGHGIPVPARSPDAAASGMDNFFAGKADTDPGARKPKMIHPARNSRASSPRTRQEREDRLNGMFALDLFQKLDRDGDGVLSWDELRPLRDVISFDKFDTDDNGSVSWQEFNNNYKHIRAAARDELKRREHRDAQVAHAPVPRERTRDERTRPVRETILER